MVVLTVIFDKLVLILYDWVVDYLNKDRHYLVVGRQPFAFWWLKEFPYVVDRPICFKNGAWCDEGIQGYPRVVLRILDPNRRTVTIVLKYDEDYAAMTFFARRGEDGHPHPNGGAHWVTMDWSVLK